MKQVKKWLQRRQWQKKYAQALLEAAHSPKERMRFHQKSLDEYLLRWLGFCRLETEAPLSLVDNQLFLVVEAATKVAGDDLETANNPTVKQAWKKYTEAVAKLRKCDEQLIKENAEQAYLRFKEFANVEKTFN